MATQKMKQVVIRMPAWMHRKATAAARKDKISFSEFVRQGTEDLIWAREKQK